MQKLFFIFFMVFSHLFVSGQNDGAAVRAEMQVQQTLWNKGDLRGFMEYYWKSDSLKFIGSKGITYGWQKTLDNYIKGYPDKAAMGILKFTIAECTQLSATSIYVIGRWELQKKTCQRILYTALEKDRRQMGDCF